MKSILPTNRTFGKLCVMERADVPTLPGLLDRAAAQFPTAGVAFEDGRQTYAELLASATEYARRLRTLGIEKGDKVGIFAGDRPEYLWALYGATLLGAVAVPVNGRFKVRELRHAITNAEIKVLFCGGGFAEPRRARRRGARGHRGTGGRRLGPGRARTASAPTSTRSSRPTSTPRRSRSRTRG